MKHDRAKQEKRQRSLSYANRFRQYVCKSCKHRTSRLARKGKCPQCRGDMKLRRRKGNVK